ncbi:N-acetyltransferase 6 [Balamuthia mandrillaris]
MEKTSGEQHLHYSDSEGGLKVVAAHEVDHLLQKAAELLNGHWKQGEEVRLAGLRKSCDTFPLHLLLVDAEENVLAHSKLSHVDSHNGQGEAALIESVIVDPTLRGKGLGRIIMEATEKAAIERHCFTLYLSTADKQEFYRHLGFTECEPVTSLGSNAKQISSAQLSALARIFGGQGGPKQGINQTWMKKVLQN